MRYEIEGKLLSDIGDAIREKTGKSELMLPGDMPGEIESIKSKQNLFTGIFEQGSFTFDGLNANITVNNRIRSHDFYPVTPGRSYIFSVYVIALASYPRLSVSFYKNDNYSDNRLSYINFVNTSYLRFTVPDNAYYVRLLIAVGDNSEISVANIILPAIVLDEEV